MSGRLCVGLEVDVTLPIFDWYYNLILKLNSGVDSKPGDPRTPTIKGCW